ncbi:hypothetical protein CPB83DRAFT_795444 [Crepidotus variabilis]|uniref:Bromodomain associated domain-containing protein n=1 Tax=Crepidotus variabilis TaxID=179855 RepID=A0A9P6EBK1_9AGAR|nr:hypothetical protein CPB83DRAFT_795444 [Crepidotus variabilis]
MESGAFKLLESATQRTLHAHAFSRSSSQASLVLSDLLARYLALLTSTCAKYAQHAGRSTMNVRDVLGVLEELGVNLEELNEFAATEGKELGRYALYSGRRVEDLNELKTQLAEGLRQDRDDAIPLEYGRCPTPLLEELDEEEYESDESDIEMDEETRSQVAPDATNMEVDVSPDRIRVTQRKRPPSRPITPQLPLSPISNTSSPRRKRLRRADWDPPEYIPDFLPPFPSLSEDAPGSPIDNAPTPQSQPSTFALPQALEVPIDKPVLLSQSLTTAAASDMFVQVPYSQSSLASVSERHLPSAIPPPAPPTRQKPITTLQIEPSLLGAYHHILTHPPPPELPASNPARHKVALSLIKQSQTTPRYHPADSVFGSVAPCPPRVSTIAPSYPVAIGETPNEKGKDSKDKDFKLPPAIPRPIAAIDRIVPFISQQNSQIPNLALHVLPPAIYARTSRLSHPPVLMRGTKALIYGPGIAAPWNSSPSTDSNPVPATPLVTKDQSSQSNNNANNKDKPPLPDARLYATWDYEAKDFRHSIAPTIARNGRSRIGSLQAGPSGSGIISLPIARTKGVK